MNENVQKLIDALRSGQYKQGDGRLRITDRPDHDTLHCCLGVACELYEKTDEDAHWTDWDYFYIGQAPDDEETPYASAEFLPEPVMAWLGFAENDGQLTKEGQEKYDYTSLVALNDAGMSFDLIADVIEGGYVKMVEDAS